MSQFYAYLWLRASGTPYYAGKGHGDRAFRHPEGRINPPRDAQRIRFFFLPDESAAFAFERMLIRLFGRKDFGTGCLRNLTDGGEGRVGAMVSEETRRKQSAAKKGKPSSWKGHTASAETRLKQSIAAKNRPCLLAGWNKGQPLTVAHKQKQSAGLKKFWATHERAPISEETRQKMRTAKLRNKNRLGGNKYAKF